MTIILIMLVQAIPVWIVALIWKRRTFVTLTAVFMALLALATGAPSLVLIDWFGIGIAYWIGISHIDSHAAARENLDTTIDRASSSDSIQGGTNARKAPSDLLNLPDREFVAGVRKAFEVMNENALIMTLVAYVNQKVLLEVIEANPRENGDLPRSLEGLIRVTDPFVNETRDEIAGARRYWFTMAGLLMRVERLAADRPDAYEMCVHTWIRIVTAARLTPDVLRHNVLWSDEEKELLTLSPVFEPGSEDVMRNVHDIQAPEFVRSDLRMKKCYSVTVRGMSEEAWNDWQAEKKANEDDGARKTAGLDS